MPIDERRELNKSSTRYKSRAYGKCSDPVAVGYVSDGKSSKVIRGRARSRKETPPVIIMHPDLLPKGKESMKGDDNRRCMSPPKQPLKKDNVKPTEAKVTSSTSRLRSSMKGGGCPANMSMEVRTNAHAGSQRSLELMFIRKREPLISPQADSPRPATANVSPVRRSSVSPKPSPVSRPATAPTPLGKSLPSFPKGSGCWRPAAPSPEVLLWIPQGTSLEEASERAKNFLTGNFPPRPPLTRQAPVLAGPPVTNRKVEGRPFSTSPRKVTGRNDTAPRGSLQSSSFRPNELWRTRFSRLLQKSAASGESGCPKPHSPQEGRSRPQSPAPRAANEASKRRQALGATSHQSPAPRKHERSRLTEQAPTSTPTMPQRWSKRPDNMHSKKMVHMCKSCSPMEGGRFFSEMTAFLPVRKDTLVILKPFDCRSPNDTSTKMTLQKSFSETVDTVPATSPITIRKLESETDVIKDDPPPIFSKVKIEPTPKPQITESDAEIEVIKEPSAKVIPSTPSTASPEKEHSPENTSIPYSESKGMEVRMRSGNPSPECKSPTSLETVKEVLSKCNTCGELGEESLHRAVDSSVDLFESNEQSLQEQSSNYNSTKTHSRDSIVTQVSKSFTGNNFKVVANEDGTATNVHKSCEAINNKSDNPAYFLCDLLGQYNSSSNETVSEKISPEPRERCSPKNTRRQSSSNLHIPTPHMSEVFCINKSRYGEIPSTTISKLLSPAMVGTCPRHKSEETQQLKGEKEVLRYESKLESILQSHRLSGCSLDQSPRSSSTSQSLNLKRLHSNEAASPNKDHEQQKLAHNVYVTYVSPLIVQSQGTEDENKTRELTHLVNDLMTSRDVLRPSASKPSKKHIPSTLNSIKEEATMQGNDKPDGESYGLAKANPDRQTNSLLSNIRLMQKHISAIRGNGSQGNCPQLEQMVIASNTPSGASVMESEMEQSSPGAASRVKVTESFWTALDRLVQCQEEVINAFASYSDTCEAFTSPIRRNLLQTEEDQCSKVSEGSAHDVNSSATAEEDERSLGTWEVPPLSDSYESEDEYSSTRQDRTYHLSCPRAAAAPLHPSPLTLPQRDSLSDLSSVRTATTAERDFSPRLLASLLNSSSMSSATGKSGSTLAATTATRVRDFLAESRWRCCRGLEAKTPRRALPSKGLRALKARAGVSAPTRRAALWRKGQARTGLPLAPQVAAAAVAALARSKVKGKAKEAPRRATSPVRPTTNRRHRSSSVSPCNPLPSRCSSPRPPTPTPSHSAEALPKPSASPSLSSKGTASVVMSLSELIKQATGGKLGEVGEKFDQSNLTKRMKRKSRHSDIKDGVLSKDEEIFCPDARCSVRLTPQTLLAHLAASHRQALSTIARPGHAVSVSLRPADLMPAVPCIAAFLHVTDRMDFGPFLLMVATSRDAGTVNGNGSSTQSSGMGTESSSSPSSAEGVDPGVRKVFPALPPPLSTSPRPDITLIAWLVEIHPRSSCTVRVLRRCDCSRRLCAAASYTGDTVALRRSQRLEDVLATGAYVVAHPQLLARLQQCGGEVEVSATVLPGYASDEDASCGEEWSLHEDSSVFDGGPGEISIVEEESEVSEESVAPQPLHACLTIPCA